MKTIGWLALTFILIVGFLYLLVYTGQALFPPEPDPRNRAELVQRGDTYLDRETMQPYSGPVFALFPLDSLKVEITFVLLDGKLDGPYERYYESGQLQYKNTYRDGEPHGPYEVYYANGQLRAKGTRDSSSRCGEWFYEGETGTYDPCPPDLEDKG